MANELVLLGEPLSAVRAAQFGLVNRVVPSEDVIAVALDIAARVAAMPRRTLRRARELLNLAARESAAASLAAFGSLPSSELIDVDSEVLAKFVKREA
jgi:enoyl-CoA hydratase/carnithine racemase